MASIFTLDLTSTNLSVMKVLNNMCNVTNAQKLTF